MDQQLTKKHQKLYDKALKNGMDAQSLDRLFNKFIDLQQREQKAAEELAKINKALANKERKARTARLIVMGLVAEKYFSEGNNPGKFLVTGDNFLSKANDRNIFSHYIQSIGRYYTDAEQRSQLAAFLERYTQKTTELTAKAKAEALEKSKAKKNAQAKDETEKSTEQ